MSLLTDKEREEVLRKVAYEVWLSVNKLGNGYPHGCEEWKAFSKRKRDIRKKLYEFFVK